MWLLVGTALASEPPVVTVEPDGTVLGIVQVEAAPDAVRALLGDAHRASALSPDVRGLAIEGTEGGCERLRKHTRGALRPFELVALRCATAHGWREDLVESGDFAAYATEWRLSSAPGGTRVEYRVRAELRLPFPAAAVRAGIEDGTRAALENLQASVR